MPAPRNRRLSGKLAKQNGQSFENDILIATVRGGWVGLRIPDGCKQVYGGKIVRIKSPFDYIIAKNFDNHSEHIYFDAKHTSAKAFPTDKIKWHQFDQLSKFDHIYGVSLGYIVQFKAHGCVVFFSTKKLASAMRSRKGLTPSDGLILGSKFSLNFDEIVLAKKMNALGEK